MAGAVVDLSGAENSVLLQATGSASRLGCTFEFTVQAEGVPEYQFTSGNFYFRATSVEIVSLEQTESETADETVSRVGNFVRDLFPEREGVIDELEYAAEQLAPETQAWLEKKVESIAGSSMVPSTALLMCEISSS